MSVGPVDALYSEFTTLRAFLLQSSEISFVSDVDAIYRKSLLLAAASYFESEVAQILKSFTAAAMGNNVLIQEFVDNAAIKRRFHTFFDWNTTKANGFFALFGERFKTFMVSEVNKDQTLQNSIKAFLEVGRERNMLVHENFAAYSLEKTTEEIFALYRNARYFVELLPEKLREFSSSTIEEETDPNLQ